MPKEIIENFNFHDGTVFGLERQNNDLIMTVCEDTWPIEEDDKPYVRITFTDGEVIERDENLIFGHIKDVEWDGKKYAHYCHWLYEELYKTDDGYEAHMLLCAENLCYLTIRCRDIKFEHAHQLDDFK